MDIWRPAAHIKVKALGLHWRDGKLLAAEIRGDDGALKGVRPLGGSVEFFESASTALSREFEEEIGIEVPVNGSPLVFENLFRHEGVQGHEIVFVYHVSFPPGTFDGQNEIAFRESDGSVCVARWYGLHELDREGGVQLFPAGLKERLDLVARRSS